MSDSQQKSIPLDRDCRRSEIERRMFSYSLYIPERRSGKDRRFIKDLANKIKKGIPSDIKKD